MPKVPDMSRYNMKQRILILMFNNEEAKQPTLYLNVISRKLAVTHPHIMMCCKYLEDNKYINTKRIGRKKFVNLTEKGKKIGRLYCEIAACERC